MQIKRVIPNLFTLGNLACGSVAILLLFHPGRMSDITMAWTIAALMVAAMLFDFADGFVARLLKVASPIGKQLDSLADMVSFGLLPGILIYYVLYSQVIGAGEFPEAFSTEFLPRSWVEHAKWHEQLLPYVGLLIPLFSAYRLAKFNVDERSGDHFYGFPTPANAFLMLSLFLIYMLGKNPDGVGLWATVMTDPPSGFLAFLTRPYFLAPLTLLFSILLITDIPLLSFKFKNASFKDNAMRYVLLGISVILLLLLRYKAMPIIIASYFILSFIDRAIQKK